MRQFWLFPLLCVACNGDGPNLNRQKTPSMPGTGSPNARPEMVESFLEDLAAPRHASDGAGRAWLVDPEPATVTTAGTWTLAYEAGPLGVEPGGGIYLQVSPFWGWDTPQPTQPDGPGYTTVSAEQSGVNLRAETIGKNLMIVHVEDRKLAAGEQIRIVYGAGSMGARADMYAERASRFWIAVDGDGDGIRKVLKDSPTLEVLPGPAERLLVTATSTASPGDLCRINIALLDHNANAGVQFSGEVQLVDPPEGWGLPSSVTLEAEDLGRASIEVPAASQGVFRFHASVTLDGQEIFAESNPLLVQPDCPKIYWADLHGHTGLSDGTGTPDDYLAYARDIAALDVIALTDHDHYGLLFLDANPDRWQAIQDSVERANDPGRFLTLLGYEWTSWIHGHRHVVYFEAEGEVYSSLSDEADTPQELWELLRGEPALTLTHHSAGEPIAADWSIPPDPELEPLAEIMSVHGSSEAEDSPLRLRGFRPGNSIRSALDRGYELGFVGSGDSHDGHPGLPHLSPYSGYRPPTSRSKERMGTGGLAAIRATSLERLEVLGALRDRAVYATSGPRIFLEVSLGDTPQGGRISPVSHATLDLRVIGTSAIESIDVVRSGEISSRTSGDKQRDLALSFDLENLTAGEYVYLRVVQSDRGLAWSSPIFVGRP